MNIRFPLFLLPVLLSAACTQDAQSSHDKEVAPISDVPLPLTQAQIFYPSADAEVGSATPNTNYGNSNELGSDSDPVRHAHLRFEVSGLAGPVQSAKLRCYARNGSVNGPALYRTQGAWTEQGLTWNNRPSTTGPALVDLGNIPHGTWVEVDVTSAVQGEGTYAFAWVPTSSDSMICDSRETARRPELRVEAEIDPSGPRPGEVLAWSEDFDGTSLDPTNWTVSTGTENHSQSHYIQGAVRVQNGALAIRTRRHCVSGSEALTDANVSSAPCPSGKTTRYSSGKVQTPLQFEPGRLEIRAKLPSAQTGVTPAIWMRNEASWCAPGYGGIDVAKWQGSDPMRSWSATQGPCVNGTPPVVGHPIQHDTNLADDWHVWSVRFGPEGVRFELDGQVLHSSGGNDDTSTDSAEDFPGLSSSDFAAVMEQLWQLRFNTEVRKSGDAHPAPSNSAPFPEGTLLVDWVRYYVEEPTPEPEGWTLHWSDEFDGDHVDETSWRIYHNTYGDGNNELACLTPNNVNVHEGALHIVAQREQVTCPGGAVRQFSSGFLGTRERGLYFPRFARFEMRAKLPHMHALWPAFWLRHRDGASVAEIDVMEYFHASDPGATSIALHLHGTYNILNGIQTFEAPTLNPGWHVWAVEIEPGANNQICFRYFVDDNEVTPNGRPAGQPACVNDPGAFQRYPGEPLFDIAVNLAVGGNWVGHPDGPLDRLNNGRGVDPTNVQPTTFPAAYVVDYVRVYTRSE